MRLTLARLTQCSRSRLSDRPISPRLQRGLVQMGVAIALGITTSVGVIAIAPRPALANAEQARMEELRSTTERWIEINVARQRLIAWEGNTPVYAVIVSTGKASTPTPTGVFQIYAKRHPERMRGPGYDVPDVPHAMYYHRGYAIHGAYWHNRFGTPVSHGCTNVATDHAQWLYNWAEVGTPVVVHASAAAPTARQPAASSSPSAQAPQPANSPQAEAGRSVAPQPGSNAGNPAAIGQTRTQPTNTDPTVLNLGIPSRER